MSNHVIRIWSVLALAGALAAPAAAENPKVTLSAHGVTADEVVAQLARAADTSLTIYGNVGASDPLLLQKSDWDWKDVPLAQAMRQVCAKYSLRTGRAQIGFVFYANQGAPPAAAAKQVGVTEKDGVKLWVNGTTIYESRQLNLTDGAPGNESGGGSLQVQLGALLGSLDPDSMAGLQNVTAKDDQGNTLALPNQGYYGGYAGGAFPDEWAATMQLPAPHPKARKLQWVEGDVMVYKRVKPFRVEIPLPLTDRVIRKQVNDLAFSVSEYKLRTQDAEDDPEPLLNRNQPVMGNVLTLRTRVYTPASGGPQSRSGWGMVPYLVGKSGKIYVPTQNIGGRSGSDGQTTVVENTLSFPGLSEAPAKLVWDLLDRGEIEKLFSFRITDVPLPRPVEFNAKAAAPQPGTDTPVADHPFYEKGGATLVSPVTLPEKGVRSGRLDLGLSPKIGAGWGPVRWIQLDVADGEAKLENVKPGLYKIVRRFKPRDEALAPGGHWVNGDVQTTLATGKDLRLPSLEWSTAKAMPTKVGAKS
jgi:hypothetical protein